MFIGHFAVGFASKSLAPRASLGVLMAAPNFLDLLWPIFFALGWEEARIDHGNTAFTPLDFVSYPISHSLVTSIGWGVLFALLYWTVSRYARGAVVMGLAVVSHWFLGFITHRPDMPLYPGGPRVGLGLWNSVAGTVLVEAVMFAGGVWLYRRATRARDRTGRYALWGFVAFLIVMYIGAAAGPPPPNTRVLIALGFFGWLGPLWAWWIDRHREGTHLSETDADSPGDAFETAEMLRLYGIPVLL